MKTKKRKPMVAALLSIVAPGLGQVYNGQLMKGILFLLVPSSVVIIILMAGFQNRFYGMIFYKAFSIVAFMFIAGEAFFTARRLKEITLRSFNKLPYYLLFLILSIGMGVVSSYLYDIKPQKISTASMEPTVHVNDAIFINTKYYKDNSPDSGDIIVFKVPNEPSRVSIKRIIAVGGDVIESVNKVVYVNGHMLTEPYIQHVDNNIESTDKGPRDNFGPFTVPKSKIFVMGDNRDRSYDSRFISYIDETQIIGKAAYIYWSKETSRIGMVIK